MRRLLLIVCVFMSAAALLQAADYTLLATPQSVEWGYHSSEAKPAMTVHSGDTVRIQTISTCVSRDDMVKQGVKAPDSQAYTDSIYKEMPKDVGAGGHILTGPIAVVVSEPGDVLEVQILRVDIDVDITQSSTVMSACMHCCRRKSLPEPRRPDPVERPRPRHSSRSSSYRVFETMDYSGSD